jgi:hypothetical protein
MNEHPASRLTFEVLDVRVERTGPSWEWVVAVKRIEQ